jgi:hypothetical protein
MADTAADRTPPRFVQDAAPVAPPPPPLWMQRLWFYYLLCGAMHEVAHVVVAAILFRRLQEEEDGRGGGAQVFLGGVYRLLLGRCFVLPDSYVVTDDRNDDYALAVIRHAGWMASVALLLLSEGYSVWCHRDRRPAASEWRIAAALTALEALATDYLALPHTLPLSGMLLPSGTTFLCGNFGIIVLHHLWFTSHTDDGGGGSVWDLLERMIQVTMIRGAQSGGVISYIPTLQRGAPPRGGQIHVRAVRTRVVNGKRTDLAQTLRRQVQREVGGPTLGRSRNQERFFLPGILSGHTRFATSSKATLDGTHPHIWTPPSRRRCYNLFDPWPRNSAPTVTIRSVANYVTHNGDLDFYRAHGVTYDLHDVLQPWLEQVTHVLLPAPVDSVVIAGLVDLLRTQGCFGLALRYAICGLSPLPSARDTLTNMPKRAAFPEYADLERIGMVFEQALSDLLRSSGGPVHATGTSLEALLDTPEARRALSEAAAAQLRRDTSGLLHPLAPFLVRDTPLDPEAGSANSHPGGGATSDTLWSLCQVTVDAFLDNDLFFATKTFLQNAKGSFGLCISSTLDAHRQVCMAARGQTMSVAFYPNKGLICFGSEQASVKAAMHDRFRAVESPADSHHQSDIDHDALRLDLDDFGGEVICIDWSARAGITTLAPVSKPHRGMACHKVMHGTIDLVLFQQSKATTQDPQIFHRMTRLSRNPFIKPLSEESDDLILTDIHDIPKVCRSIQDEWKSDRASTSLNRLTAYNLSRCLRNRLESHVNGTVHPHAIDILLTGCEVSLWLAEQFASDLQKSFPALNIQAVSSNKLLGLYGQEIAIPTLGFPYRHKAHHMHDAIVIIVSHSGGTFAPLSCSNLLQVCVGCENDFSEFGERS